MSNKKAFNFGEWLESMGWKRDTMTSLRTYRKITQRGDYHRIMIYDDCMELHLVDLGGTILQETIKYNCLAPTSDQEAVTLFKLLKL